MFDNNLLQKIHDLDVVGIRTEDFDSYLNMWVVVVDGRLFARSWSTSPQSWFWAFKEARKGLMQIDDTEHEVTAMVASNNEALHLAINDAYQARYGEGEASMIAGAMQARSRWPMTMEFKIKVM